MSRYYYFAATLPSLQFGVQAPFPDAEFLERCATAISARDLAVLRRVTVLSPPEGLGKDILAACPLLAEYHAWERALRAALATARGQRLDRQADRWIRAHHPGEAAFRSAAAVLQAPDPLASELVLERERWNRIESLASIHIFDLDALAAYRLRLQTIERLGGLTPGKGEPEYRRIYAAILGPAEKRDTGGA